MQPPPEVECRSQAATGCLPLGVQPAVTKHVTHAVGIHSKKLYQQVQTQKLMMNWN